MGHGLTIKDRFGEPLKLGSFLIWFAHGDECIEDSLIFNCEPFEMPVGGLEGRASIHQL